MPTLGLPNAFQSFEMGRQLQGTSGLGEFAKEMTERVKSLELLKAKAGFEAEAEFGKERALSPFRIQEAGEKARAEAQAQASVFRDFRDSAGGGGDMGDMRLSSLKLGPATYESPEAQAEEAALTEEFRRGAKLQAATRRLAVIGAQFKEALPSTGRAPAFQRFMGLLQAAGAETGIIPNPRALALVKGGRPMAISIVRDLGEVGNLSESDIASAVDTVSQANLTEEERLEFIRTFGEFALAGMSPRLRGYVLQDQDVQHVIESLGIRTDVKSFADTLRGGKPKKALPAGYTVAE